MYLDLGLFMLHLRVICFSSSFSFVSNQIISLTFHDGARYHIETNPLICSANHWTGFYMITASVMKGLKQTHLLFYTFFRICTNIFPSVDVDNMIKM